VRDTIILDFIRFASENFYDANRIFFLNFLLFTHSHPTLRGEYNWKAMGACETRRVRKEKSLIFISIGVVPFFFYLIGLNPLFFGKFYSPPMTLPPPPPPTQYSHFTLGLKVLKAFFELFFALKTKFGTCFSKFCQIYTRKTSETVFQTLGGRR
jgi:hypothetical protein